MKLLNLYYVSFKTESEAISLKSKKNIKGVETKTNLIFSSTGRSCYSGNNRGAFRKYRNFVNLENLLYRKNE